MQKNKLNFREFLTQKSKTDEAIIFDGGIGTMIQKEGIVGYQIPEDLNFYHPEIIKKIHTQYLEAGCNVLTANSFGANPLKLKSENTRWSAQEYIRESIKLQKEAISEFEKKHQSDDFAKINHFVSWDSGQIGRLMEPMGPLTFDEAYNSYKEAALCAEKEGADLAILETMSDLYEVKAAVLAIQENTSLPVAATMTFQQNLRTLTGADVLTCITYLESLHVDILGFNCGGSLEEDAKLAQEFLSYAHIPVLIQPNAGLPEHVNGKDVFKVEAEEFANFQVKNYVNGAKLLGGCCGTNPSHIKKMAQEVKKLAVLKNQNQQNLQENCETSNHQTANFETSNQQNLVNTYVCSYNKTQQIGGNYGPVIIGERINPTGKKKCQAALKEKNMQFILDEAESQISSGAHILDVNVGLPGLNETQMMCLAIKSIQSTFNVPLQIDSSEDKVLEKALRYYNGKALVNSVNGKQEVMDKVFPLIKHYGGAIVALCIDEDGISPSAQGRVKVAKKIIAEAAKYGIPVRDIFIDTLTLTVSSEQKTALETIKAIRMLKEEFGSQGLQFVLGVSNISFGLPRRDIINSRFFTLALDAGLSAAIINPGAQSMIDTYRAYRALSSYDENCIDYIDKYTGSLDPSTEKAKNKILQDAVDSGKISICINGTDFKTPKFFNQNNSSENNFYGSSGSNSASSSSASSFNSTQNQQIFSSSSSANSANPENSESQKKTENFFVDEKEANLRQIIEKGFKDKSAKITEELLENHKPVEIINNCIVPALDNVGKDFEQGKKFLPQLLLSADTVGNSFGKIKEVLSKTGVQEESKGSIVLATVFGDIHDIGKNIVKAMLENYGYTVIDLGKNVPPEKIVQTVIENNIKLVGLSALMTTTVANMELTIKMLRKKLKEINRTCKICVGGAVLTEDYAKKIDADYYTKDAMQTVSVAKEVFGK